MIIQELALDMHNMLFVIAKHLICIIYALIPNILLPFKLVT